MSKRARWLQVACSLCGAKIGDNCNGVQGQYRAVHSERLDLTNLTFGVAKTRGMIGKRYPPGPRCSSACKDGGHKGSPSKNLCKGLVAKKYGQQLTCTCACHKVKDIEDMIP